MKLGTFALCTAIFTFGFWTFMHVQTSSDMGEHIAYAERIHSIADLTSPHFLFQLVLKALHAFGLTYVAAAALAQGLCYGGMAVLIAREIERRGEALTAVRAFLLVPAVLLASHVFLLTIFTPTLYRGYFVPISYHNPTQQLNKLFALWIYFIYCAQFLDSRRAELGPALSTGVLAVLSALAKPSFLVAFLPTAGLFSLADLWRRRWRQVSMFAMCIAVPVVLVLAWQASLTFTLGDGNRVIFAPFAVFDPTTTLYKLPASLAFPLIVAALAIRGRIQDSKFAFAWAYAGVALFVTLFLAETARLLDGNFAWTGQTGVFLVYVESLLLLIGRPELSGWRSAAWTAFAVHVLCGIVWYGGVFFRDLSVWM